VIRVNSTNSWLIFSCKSLFFGVKLNISEGSAKTTVSFSKMLKTVQFLSIFEKNETFFAKTITKIAKSGSKTFHFGAPSFLRRCF